MRELYCAGETGNYWKANNFSYENTKTKIKMKGYLSYEINENRGVKQGRIKSLHHYKMYINPLLDMIYSAKLGVWLRKENISQSTCADDVFLITDSQSKLQGLLDIAEHYGEFLMSLMEQIRLSLL